MRTRHNYGNPVFLFNLFRLLSDHYIVLLLKILHYVKTITETKLELSDDARLIYNIVELLKIDYLAFLHILRPDVQALVDVKKFRYFLADV